MLGWDSSNPLQYALNLLSSLCRKCAPCPELEQHFSFKSQIPDWLSSSWMQPHLRLALVVHHPGWKHSCFQFVFKRKLKIIICLFISLFFPKNTEEIELLWRKVVGMAFGWCRWLLASFYIHFLSIFKDCPWLVSIILGSLKRFCLFVLTLSLKSWEGGEIFM